MDYIQVVNIQEVNTMEALESLLVLTKKQLLRIYI